MVRCRKLALNFYRRKSQILPVIGENTARRFGWAKKIWSTVHFGLQYNGSGLHSCFMRLGVELIQIYSLYPSIPSKPVPLIFLRLQVPLILKMISIIYNTVGASRSNTLASLKIGSYT